MKLKLKETIFSVNSSTEAIILLVQKALLTCKIKQKITPVTLQNLVATLKLDLSEKANRMGAPVVHWDL